MAFIVIALLASCGGNRSAVRDFDGGSDEDAALEAKVKKGIKPLADQEVAVIETSDYGTIVVELYSNIAPLMVERFKKLITAMFEALSGKLQSPYLMFDGQYMELQQQLIAVRQELAQSLALEKQLEAAKAQAVESTETAKEIAGDRMDQIASGQDFVGQQMAEIQEAYKLPPMITTKTEMLTKQVTEEARKDPAALAQIIRTWLNESS